MNKPTEKKINSIQRKKKSFGLKKSKERKKGVMTWWGAALLDRWRPERNHSDSNPNFGGFATQNVVSTIFFKRQNKDTGEEEDVDLRRVLSSHNNGNEIPLRRFCAHAGFLSFQPPRFCAATCHLENTTTQVFDRGNCVVVGSPSMEEVVWAAQRLRFYLRDEVGIDLKLNGVLMRNRVCSCRMNFAIDIKGFERYEFVSNVKQPDSFPGMIRKERTKSGNEIVYLIFETGSCIAMGLLNPEEEHEIQEAFDIILPLMLRNKKSTADTSRGQQKAVRQFTKKLEKLFDPTTSDKASAAQEEDEENLVEQIMAISDEAFPGSSVRSRPAKRQKK